MAFIYETDHFEVTSCEKPFISRHDGGHIQIAAKTDIDDRTKLSPKQAVEFMRLTMLVGGAFQIAMNGRGIPVVQVDYENFAGYDARLHMHLLGRAVRAGQQAAPKSMYFSLGEAGVYNNSEPLNEMDVQAIQNQIRLFEQTEKYKAENWELKR